MLNAKIMKFILLGFLKNRIYKISKKLIFVIFNILNICIFYKKHIISNFYKNTRNRIRLIMQSENTFTKEGLNL